MSADQDAYTAALRDALAATTHEARMDAFRRAIAHMPPDPQKAATNPPPNESEVSTT